MKGVKCFGLLLVLFIMLGLSLSVFSDASALKYPIDNFDFSPTTAEFDTIYDTYTQQDVYILYEKSHQFSISIPYDLIPSDFQFPRVWEYEGSWSYDGSCSLRHYYDGVHKYLNTGTAVSVFSIQEMDSVPSSLYSVTGVRSPVNWSYEPWQIISSINLPFGANFCNIYGYPYVDFFEENPGIFSNWPRWNFSTLNTISDLDGAFYYKKNKPYFYAFNTLGLRYQQRVDDELVNYDTLTSRDIFNVPVSTFNDMTVSISNYFSSPNTDPSPDPDINYDVFSFAVTGRLNFYGPYDLGDYAGVKLLISDYNDDNFSTENLTAYSITGNAVFAPDSFDLVKNCNITEHHLSSFDPSGNYIDFYCSYNPSLDGGREQYIDFDKLSINIRFTGDATSVNAEPWHQFNFVESDYMFAFQDFNIITNGDDTPAGFSGSPTGTGGDLPSQPGHTNTNDPSGIPGFSLDDLFAFNFLNPFNGIFNLFSDNSSCVAIPNLASMLHSNEVNYCPWFDATTRNVLTPVFGITGTMLVFGFLIRWLSSSSGNLFEDSSSETLSNSAYSYADSSGMHGKYKTKWHRSSKK